MKTVPRVGLVYDSPREKVQERRMSGRRPSTFFGQPAGGLGGTLGGGRTWVEVWRSQRLSFPPEETVANKAGCRGLHDTSHT